ncbi:MAG TPA: altronate dehydratase family protein [Terriglobales bacterium]|nr:altronate dehydratase family protein [Terriglobales bacterium]
MPETLTQTRILKLDRRDNVMIALADLRAGEEVSLGKETHSVVTNVAAKHKFALKEFAPGDQIIMYGVVVGKATQPIREGEVITTRNIRHEASDFHQKSENYAWHAPDVSGWKNRTFLGYKRADGQVGTRNYWLVVPLVFCENRNIDVLRKAFDEGLGYAPPQVYRQQVADLARLYREGRVDAIKTYQHTSEDGHRQPHGFFENVDGVKFLTHERGCGGTREDARNLCGLIAGYLHHPNVAGATVLSLGCQHSQADILREEIAKRDTHFAKPLILLEQQGSASERAMLSQAIRETFLGLVQANRAQREPASLDKLCVGLKCGGSDGFSGLSANPAIGHVSDLLAALGGSSILAEFPELCGVEQALINRSTSQEVADRFITLMRDYAARAKAVRASFEMNPSPGNIKDGLITDAMKSAGAARKGGDSPVTAVLDYPEYATEPGLNLLCTPGSDVEAVTAQVGAGANVVLFTTGLGTPTGNPIAPVIKISTNSQLAQSMADAIDVDTGTIIAGEESVEDAGERILGVITKVASGEMKTKAELLGQDDFIPWKRGVSL